MLVLSAPALCNTLNLPFRNRPGTRRVAVAICFFKQAVAPQPTATANCDCEPLSLLPNMVPGILVVVCSELAVAFETVHPRPCLAKYGHVWQVNCFWYIEKPVFGFITEHYTLLLSVCTQIGVGFIFTKKKVYICTFVVIFVLGIIQFNVWQCSTCFIMEAEAIIVAQAEVTNNCDTDVSWRHFFKMWARTCVGCGHFFKMWAPV